MYVVTFATKADGAYNYLKKSMERLSGPEHELLTVGWGQSWAGFGDRIIKYREAIDSLHDDAVCLFVDGYDVILTGDLGEMERQYREMSDKKVVFSTETQTTVSALGNLLLMGRAVKEKNKSTPIFICAGAFIAYVSSAKSFFDQAIATGHLSHRHADDQHVFTTLCRDSPEKYGYDTDSRWFVTWPSHLETHVGKHIELSRDGTLTYKGRSGSFVLHRQFAARLEDTLESLGYEVPTDDKKLLVRDPQYNWKFAKHHVRHKWYLLLTVVQKSFYLLIMLVIIAILTTLVYRSSQI